MKKLGITHDAPPVADDVDNYTQAFVQGLTEEQVALINDLFAEHVPTAESIGEDDEAGLEAATAA